MGLQNRNIQAECTFFGAWIPFRHRGAPRSTMVPILDLGPSGFAGSLIKTSFPLKICHKTEKSQQSPFL